MGLDSQTEVGGCKYLHPLETCLQYRFLIPHVAKGERLPMPFSRHNRR